jgi:protein Tex
VAPEFNDAIREIADIKPGMSLEGVVTNVTKFGAFVDIGIHQDGLVHISELSDRYVKDPNDAVKVGQIVKVHVLSVDPKIKRIALSMKTGKSVKRPGPVAPPPMEDRIASLADRWKSR